MNSMRPVPSLRRIDDLPDLSKRQAGRVQIALRPEVPEASTETQRETLEKAAKQGVDASLPERIIWKWLETQRLAFAPQYVEMGGRLTVGGAVIDFLVWGLSGVPVAIRVQGGYWHGPTFHERTIEDQIQADRLRGQGYLVLDLWEQDIYDAVRFDRLDAYIRNEL